MPKPIPETPYMKLYDQCDTGNDSLKRLRDYASQPGNLWLARSELSKLSQTLSELEQILEELKEEEAK